MLESSRTQIAWDVFNEAFYEKYILAFVWNAKKLEFMRLTQGGMSVAEYTAKLDKLCKFSTIY